MKWVGRAIQRATCTTGGAAGPGGSESRMGRPYSCRRARRRRIARSPIWQCSSSMQGGPLDHVALWTDERDALAEFLCERAGMHVIDRTDTFTLVGADAKKGKLTLFDADGPRDPGVLGHVGLTVHEAELAGDVS